LGEGDTKTEDGLFTSCGTWTFKQSEKSLLEVQNPLFPSNGRNFLSKALDKILQDLNRVRGDCIRCVFGIELRSGHGGRGWAEVLGL
jgi:hypothetical protein